MAGLRLDASGVIATCGACGRANRLPYASLGKTTRCGQCRADIPPPAAPVEATDSRVFDAASTASALPLIVDFWAPWCGPCRMVAPELERVAAQARGRYLVVKVNTDELTDVGSRFMIRSIPTLAVVHRGRELDRLTGVRPAAEILAFAHQVVEADARRAS